MTQPFYLHRVAFIVMHTQNDLYVFRGLLFTTVKLSLKQGYINIVPHVSWTENKSSSGERDENARSHLMALCTINMNVMVSVEPCPATKTLIHLGGWSLGSPFFWRSPCCGPQSGGSPSWLEQGPLGGASGSRTALPADMWGNSMRQTLKGYV